MCSSRPLKKFCYTKNETIPSTMALRKLTFLFLFATILASAGVKNATTLCVVDNTGATLSFALQERPQMQFVGNYVVVRTSEIKLLQFRNLVKAYFIDENNDPDAIKNATQCDGQVSLQPNAIHLAGFKPFIPVHIYEINGNLARKMQINADGALTLSLDDLNTGIYVVKAGETVFKIAK